MKDILKNLCLILLGNVCYAVAIAFFIEPVGLITGGGTGIGLFVHHVTGISTSSVVFVINTVLFIVGLVILGKRFAANTLISSFVIPFALKVAEEIASHYPPIDDIVLCTVFGGLLIGASLGLVIRTGASTGGMDIPPLILHKYFGLSISTTMWVFDVIILIVQALFTDINKVLYGVILVVLYTMTLDKMLMLGKSRRQIKIVSKKSDEIKRCILQDIDRGVTMMYGRTGYLGKDTEILLSVVSDREIARVEHMIHEIDSEAFIIVSRVSEVKGRGFTKSKKYL